MTPAPEVPIIVLTDFDDTAVANMAVQDGAQDYLAKDHVDSNSLARALRHSIKRKEAQAHITHLNSVLRAIRDINPLIVVEKDRNHLIRFSIPQRSDLNQVLWWDLLERTPVSIPQRSDLNNDQFMTT